MAIPPDIKIRLEQLRAEAAARAEAQLRQQQAQANAEKMSKQFVPGKAAGGQPSLDEMRLALNRQGMYSPLEKAAMAIPRSKGTPAEFMAEISKQPGFRKEEVEDRKISLPQQKMTKQEFLTHVQKNHPAPLISEKVLGGSDYQEALDNAARSLLNDRFASFEDLDRRDQEDIKHDVGRDFGYDPETKYDEWKLPGGENYREVLLKLPQKGLSKREQEQKMWLEATLRRGQLTPDQDNQLMKLQIKEQRGTQDYQSSHWKDDPNVLAHIRLSDRIGPNKEKILHVEEIQSDWHQAGRKTGYFSGDRPKTSGQIKQEPDGSYSVVWDDGVVNKGHSLESAQRAIAQGKVSREGVPDAPFKKNWHELAIKHVLGLAAKGGYHGIAITPGDEQADRYDLSKHVDRVEYFPESGNLVAMRKGNPVIAENTTPDKLDSYLGKEVANKLLSQPPVQAKRIGESSMHLLEGQDLKVGGEGMKGFYDKIVPTFLNKLGKPHGAQVGKIPSGMQDPDTNQPINLHYFPITDSMRQQVKTEGLPQYDKGGKVDPLDFLRMQQPNEPFDPMGNLKRNVSGAWDVIKGVPGNLQRMVADPMAYLKSLPAPTGEQIMGMAAPGNLGFAGMMIGPKARTWHTGRADMAQAMENAGRTPQEIWAATGTIKGKDGIWRQEISDKPSTFRDVKGLEDLAESYKDMIAAQQMRLKPAEGGQKDFWPKALTEARKPVREEIAGLKQDLREMSRSPRTQGVPARWTLEHPELYAAYPELADLPIVQNYRMGSERGSLTAGSGRLESLDIHDPRNPRSVALHELQHAVQTIEGMSPGASPTFAFKYPEAFDILKGMREKASKPATLEEFQKSAGYPANEVEAAYGDYLKNFPSQLSPAIDRELQQRAAMEWYKRQHGEAEARATQTRADYDAAQRASKFPYESFDVPEEQLLIRPPIPYTGKVSEANGGKVTGIDHFFQE